MLSELSYRKQEYYGNPRNQFWVLSHNIFGKVPDEIYEVRKRFLTERRIAIWDVLYECDIDGSDDSSIKGPVANDIPSFLRMNSGITHIFFNGKKAAELFERSVVKGWPQGSPMPMLVTLPSSSPLNTQRFERKLEVWKAVSMVLEQ
jgi:TDG/mug DNA glycosylase family protein